MLKNLLTKLKTNSKKGMEAMEIIMAIVVVGLVVILALQLFGGKLKNLIDTTGTSIDNQATCVIKGGTWDPATQTCK